METFKHIVFISYFGIGLGLAAASVFLIAEVVFRPKSLDQLSFAQRIKISLVPLKNETALFNEEDLRKIRVARWLTRIALSLLVLRVLIAYNVVWLISVASKL